MGLATAGAGYTAVAAAGAEAAAGGAVVVAAVAGGLHRDPSAGLWGFGQCRTVGGGRSPFGLPRAW
jgi:hypothetical protein